MRACKLDRDTGRVRELVYDEPQRPTRQHPLRDVVGQPTQERWIVMSCRDREFALSRYVDGRPVDIDDGGAVQWHHYADLFSALAALDCGGKKWWLIGHRIRYALDRADFVGALERGEVELPKIKCGKNKGRHGGRLTCNQRLVEIDVVCGRNKIKMLDWCNYGLWADGIKGLDDPVSIHADLRCFVDFLRLSVATGLAVSKPTAAQVGWDNCRRQTRAGDLHVNMDAEARALERRAYHGGRCEAFRLGSIHGTTYSLDVRSCYATICRDEPMPIKLSEEYRQGCHLGRLHTDAGHQWIADVVIRTPSADYPIRWHGSPIYPIGTFVASLAWPELRHALRHGRVQRVLRAARYEADLCLSEYAQWYLAARSRCGEGYPESVGGCLKSIFNSSLGYTARQKYDWQPWQTQIGQPYWIGTAISPEDRQSVVAAQKLDAETRWLRVAGEPREAMPYLHATICSYARVRLLDIFAAARRENIHYCDTDGVLVSEAGALSLTKLGEWGSGWSHGLVERFPCGRAYIGGQKSYRVGDHAIQAGTRKTRLDMTQLKTVLTTDTGRVGGDGVVYPFEFSCRELRGGKWVNEMV